MANKHLISRGRIDEIENFLHGLLKPAIPKHKTYFEDLLRRLFLPECELTQSLKEIYLSWSNGSFIGFDKYIHLDAIISSRDPLKDGTLEAKIFAESQKAYLSLKEHTTEWEQYQKFQEFLREKPIAAIFQEREEEEKREQEKRLQEKVKIRLERKEATRLELEKAQREAEEKRIERFKLLKMQKEERRKLAEEKENEIKRQKKEEKERLLAEQRSQEEQHRLQKIKQMQEKIIFDLLHHEFDRDRSSWKLNASALKNLVQKEVTEDLVEKAKISYIKKWFSNNGLDQPSSEQARVIADITHSLRVTARAGSGKTRTIAQKIIFLIHYAGYQPGEILALVFNKKAKESLARKIKKFEADAKLPARGSYKILTFDSLAFNLVKPKEEILLDSSQKKLIKQIVLDAIDNEEGLREKVEELMINSFKSDWDKVLKIDSMSSSADLERLRSFLTEETLDGKQVKSRPEKRISDFLFEHDIPYRYELPFTVDDGNIIRPDFYIPSHEIVIEYYGLRGDAEYERSLAYKQEYWKQRSDITLIEINPGEICKRGVDYDQSRNTDYEFLIDLLAAKTTHFIDPDPIEAQQLSDEEVITKLRDRIKLRFSDLVMNAISRAGQMNCSDIQLIKDIETYPASSEEERSFLDLLPQFISMYKDRLHNNNQIDFNEVKRKAITEINNGTTCLSWDQGSNGIDLKEVKFCFVDEFQDFSELFRGLLLSILNISSDCLINAVGDDWQMINRFAGSKPELFKQFDRDYPKPKQIYLQTNYRSAGGIVDFCNQIMATNGENGRPARACHEKLDQPFKIARLERDLLEQTPREDHFFKGDATLSALFRLFKPITEAYTKVSTGKEEKICFAISRTNNPPIQVDGLRLGLRVSNKRELVNEHVRKLTPESCRDLFEAITVHSSKGLEADVVIVLQPKQFPTIHQRSIFLQFFGDTPENLLEDELKLLYVACSRAKHEIYFLPEREFMMSSYLEKIIPTISNHTWKEYPCRLSSPRGLFKISIQNVDQYSSALYNSTDVLKAHGFDTFSRPNQTATRSQVVRKTLYKTLLFLSKVVEACSKFDLKFSITDGINNEVFAFPGPKSIEQAIAECGESE